MNKPIRIFTPDINMLGEIANYESLSFVRSWHGIGDFELRINRHKQYTDVLQKGNIIAMGKSTHKVYRILHREIELDKDGKATENWRITGLELKSVVGQRITVPPPNTPYDVISGPSETAMKHYINNHLVNPINPSRKINQLVIAENMGRGSDMDWQSRFQSISEEEHIIAMMSGLGWNIKIDYDSKKWLYDVYEGKDLSVNQDVNNRVIFSPQFNNIKNMSFSDSDLNYRNAAYIGGQGEGIERRIIELGEAQGLSRHELFVDARDVPEEMDVDGYSKPQPRPVADIERDLIASGEKALIELSSDLYLEAQMMPPITREEYELEHSYLSTLQVYENVIKKISHSSTFNYEIDYDLGDIVTIQNKDWGVTLDSRITEIKEIYEVGGFSLEATFGNNRPTLIQKIKQELQQISGEVRK